MLRTFQRILGEVNVVGQGSHVCDFETEEPGRIGISEVRGGNGRDRRRPGGLGVARGSKYDG
jgi:hypothetical protein